MVFLESRSENLYHSDKLYLYDGDNRMFNPSRTESRYKVGVKWLESTSPTFTLLTTAPVTPKPQYTDQCANIS